MPCRYKLRPLRLCPLQEDAELKIAIACDTRVGRAALEVAPGKGPDHRLHKLGSQVQDGVRYAEKPCDCPCPEIVRAILRLLTLAFP